MTKAKKTPAGGTGEIIGKTKEVQESFSKIPGTSKTVKPEIAIASALSEVAFIKCGFVTLRLNVRDSKVVQCVVTTARVNK
jgi:hypothetical protein